MTQNQLMTAGAVAFAGFALWWINRGTRAQGAAIATQPAQQQRDSGLQAWFDHFDKQAAELSKGIDYSLSTYAQSTGLRF